MVHAPQGLTYTAGRRERMMQLHPAMQKEIVGSLDLGVANEDHVFQYLLAYYE
jgi:hypothetical protein